MAWEKGRMSGFAPDTFYTPTSHSGSLDIKSRAPDRTIAKHRGHRLVVDFFNRDCYDVSETGGHWYLFRYTSDKEAVARWHGWLRSRGVEV